MLYVAFTHVDILTGVPVATEPARNGPTFPAGCVFGFALESQYPTATPTFYGYTEGNPATPGILSVISKAEYDMAESIEMDARQGNPTVVTMRQAKLALRRAGLIAKANAAIAALTGDEGEEAQIEWEYASELRRDHPLVNGLGLQLGLNDAAIDALFIAASQIS